MTNTQFIQGVPTIQRAIINIIDTDSVRGKKGDKELLVEGYGLKQVMTTEGQYNRKNTGHGPHANLLL